MSGGYFDYVQASIYQLAEDLKYALTDKDRDYPELTDEDKVILEKAVEIFNITAIFVHDIDYVFSGDYGRENIEFDYHIFTKRMKKIIDG